MAQTALKQAFNKTFFDKQGQQAVAAIPNLPLIIWFGAAVAAHIVQPGVINSTMSLISLAALVIWALLEIFRGASYFRRALGLVVLAYIVYARLIH